MGCATSRCTQEPPAAETGTAARGSDDGESVSVKCGSLDCSAGLQRPPPQPAAAPLEAASPAALPAGPADAPQPQPQASEDERLELIAALRGPQLGDHLGSLTGLLGTYFEVPLACLALITEHEVVGLPCHATSFAEPRGAAVGEWPLRMPQEALLVVDDLASDPRFQDMPRVTGQPHLRFYAAVALRCSSGTLGSLCIADHKPRTFTPDQFDFLLRCAAIITNIIMDEAAAAREGRRRQQQQQQQPDSGPSQQDLANNIEGCADPTLACDLRQQAWPILACNAAAAALADLPQPLPGSLSFWSLLKVAPGMPGNANYKQAVEHGQPFSLACRLQLAAERPVGCSASGGAAVAAAAVASPAISGEQFARRASADDADAYAVRRPASGQLGSQLPALGEQQGVATAAGAAMPPEAGSGLQAAAAPEPLTGRSSLDSALPAPKRKQAPEQVYTVAFAPYVPAGGKGSLGPDATAMLQAPAAAGPPALWVATLCPRNLAAIAAQARLGLLIGRHQRQQQHCTSAAALQATSNATAGHGSTGAKRPRSLAMPRVLLPECMQGVELGPLLGTGANGRTYIARWQGSRVAVKCVELREREPEALPEYAQQAITGSGGSDPGSMALVEAVLSKALRHPHIVTTHTYGVRESGRHMGTRYKEVWIVQDLCTMGPLIRAVEQGRFKNELGAPRLLFVVLTAAEVAGALAYLHSKGVVHGDLSSNNVLLNSSTKDQRRFVALVSDFGLARPLEVLTQLSTDTYGTISFMPPELVLNQKLSPAVDIYSFGVLLWEMMSGCRAWADMSSLQILAAITTGRQLQVSDSWPRRIQSLISRCLDSNPKERPSAKAVLEELELMLAPRQ